MPHGTIPNNAASSVGPPLFSSGLTPATLLTGALFFFERRDVRGPPFDEPRGLGSVGARGEGADRAEVGGSASCGGCTGGGCCIDWLRAETLGSTDTG